METNMQAWHGSQTRKERTIERMRTAAECGQLARGTLLGTLTGSGESPHEDTEEFFGIPVRVAYWIEAVFEGIYRGKRLNWAIAALDSIPAGADLTNADHDLWVNLMSVSDVGSKTAAWEFLKTVWQYHIALMYANGKLEKEFAALMESDVSSEVRDYARAAMVSLDADNPKSASMMLKGLCSVYGWDEIGRVTIQVFRESPPQTIPHSIAFKMGTRGVY